MVRYFNVELEDKLPQLEVIREFECGKLDQPEKVNEMVREHFRLDKRAEEYVMGVYCDISCNPIGVCEISHGVVNASPVQPREVLMRGLLLGATQVVIVHNHPSGDETPSREDTNTAKRLKEGCNLIGIPLIDFIVVGDGYFSFQERGLLKDL